MFKAIWVNIPAKTELSFEIGSKKVMSNDAQYFVTVTL